MNSDNFKFDGEMLYNEETGQWEEAKENTVSFDDLASLGYRPIKINGEQKGRVFETGWRILLTWLASGKNLKYPHVASLCQKERSEQLQELAVELKTIYKTELEQENCSDYGAVALGISKVIQAAPPGSVLTVTKDEA